MSSLDDLLSHERQRRTDVSGDAYERSTREPRQRGVTSRAPQTPPEGADRPRSAPLSAPSGADSARQVEDGGALSRRRAATALLNKLTVENFPSVTDKIAVLAEGFTNKSELCELFGQIVDKSLTEAKFSEIYADVLLVLSYRSARLGCLDCAAAAPQSLPPTTIRGRGATPAGSTADPSKRPGSAANRFTTLVVEALQKAYEALMSERTTPDVSDDKEEVNDVKLRLKTVAFGRVVGELYIRNLLKFAIVRAVIMDLIAACVDGDKVNEDLVESICHFCTFTGAFMEASEVSRAFVGNIIARLSEIRSGKSCPMRIACIVQNLLDAKKANWHCKAYQEEAKALSQIKDDLEYAHSVGGERAMAQAGKVVKLGQRVNLSHGAYASYVEGQRATSQRLG